MKQKMGAYIFVQQHLCLTIPIGSVLCSITLFSVISLSASSLHHSDHTSWQINTCFSWKVHNFSFYFQNEKKKIWGKKVLLKSRKMSLKNNSRYYASLYSWNTYRLMWACYQLPVYSNAMPLKICCFPEAVILCIRTKEKREEGYSKSNFKMYSLPHMKQKY